MKIRQLHINRFGHFNECDLVFPGDGLQVIYGPNEAGKTTLLEFLRGLLFDFPARTPYDFGGQGELAGVATLEMQDGGRIELRRRKGNKDKVSIKRDDQPTDLDHAAWLRLLDHADRDLFESVFAFGLDQLSQGESSLKHESLQSALFGGGLGGATSPDKVLAELARGAEELFKKGGSKPAINVHLAEIKRLSKEIKDRSLRPDKYHQIVESASRAAERGRALHEQVDELRREHAKIEKRVRAWPKWWELQQRRRERAELGDLKPIPADARRRYQDLRKAIQTLTAEQAERQGEIEQAERSLATLHLNPDSISYRAEIKSCVELRQSFIEARNDLPQRRREHELTRRRIDEELAELRPGWSHEDLQAFSVDVETRTQLDRMSDERGERQTLRTKLSAQADADAANLERAREELVELGAPTDVTVLAGVLAEEADFTANRKQAESIQGELAKLQRKLATQIRKLTPPLPAAKTTPEELNVPRPETVAGFQVRSAELRQQLRAASQSADEDELERQKIEKQLATVMSSRVVPTLADREVARERRESGWSLVRRKYVATEQVDDAVAAWLNGEDAATLPEGYEHAVRVADEIADRLYDNANEVAAREGLQAQLTGLATRLEQKRQRLSELQLREAGLDTEWCALWQPCEFTPLAPDAMLSWLKDHEAVCATVVQRDELAEELARIGERIALFEQRLRAASGLAGDDIGVILAAARQSVEAEKDRQRRASELQKEIRRLDKQLAKFDDALQGSVARETAANEQLRTFLVRLNLPAEWDVELARQVIDKLKATRVRLDSLPVEAERISAMEARIEEFDQRVRTLCQALAPELLHDLSELAVKKFDEQVERAVEAQRKHDEYSRKLTAAQKSLETSRGRLQEADSERARMFATADATSEAEFEEAVTRAEKAIGLNGQIEQLTRELELIRAGDDREEFEQSLSTNELVALQGRERDLREELKGAESARTKAVGEEALAGDELRRLDGSGETAELAAELARRRSQLAADVDRFMPLIYARHLLNAAVSRFERDNQPEMIKTVSRLLGQMTGNKYVEFDRSGGGKQNILVRRADGVERTPDQLSTGTREQLYLAIRLAYVLYYCERNQPLPIIIDDVLVNFDETRTRQTLAAMADISKTAQVLFFTCHPHMVNLASDVVPGLKPIELVGAS